MRTIVISQPTYLPWLGYFRIMKEADVFVFLDNVQFEKRSWQCRNRIKSVVGDTWLTVPTQHDGRSRICEVNVDNTKSWMRQHWNAVQTSYGKAPYFKRYSPFLKLVYEREWTRLVDLNIHIARFLAAQLSVSPVFVQASKIGLEGKRTQLLLELCKMFGGERYLSSIGAREYMQEDGAAEAFEKAGIKVQFLEINSMTYPQLFGEFIPGLSAIDCLFNCGPDSLQVICERTKTTYYDLERMPREKAHVHENAKMKMLFSGNSMIECESLDKLPPNFKIGQNTRISGKTVHIEDQVSIGSNVIVSANNLSLGKGSEIEDGCRIVLSGDQSDFTIGDNCFIGNDSKIIVPAFKAKDYLTLHNHLLVTGYKPLLLGHNVWVGQNCILNSTDNLTIGNNVGIGAYSSVWTHGYWGEKIEGCRVFKIAPTTIEDDVFIEGCYNVISPGLTIGKKSIVLTGSVVTKDVLPFTCVAGIPARDITGKLSPYADVALEQKYEMMQEFVEDFLASIANKKATKVSDGWHIQENAEKFEILFYKEVNDNTLRDNTPKLVFTMKNNLATKSFSNVTVFDLSNKTYTKKRTDLEARIIRFLLPFRARFLPS